METEFSCDALSSLLDELMLLFEMPDDQIQFDATLLKELLVDGVSDIPSERAPPRVCVVGRAGAGKSSLINTLSRKEVAKVGTVKSTTDDRVLHEITLGDDETPWEVVDFRGVSESDPPDGAESIDTFKATAEGLTSLNPDLIIHVTTADYVRGGRDSIEAIDELGKSILGGSPPRIICINKVDSSLGPTADWPPTANQGFNESLEELLDLLEEIVSSRRKSELRDGEVLRGVLFNSAGLFNSADIIGAVPICAEFNAHWNRSGLVSLLTNHLYKEDRFREFRERRQRRIGRRCARTQTATIATAIHNLPDNVVTDERDHTVPLLKSYLVALIGAFAGQELTGAPVEEYLSTVDFLDTEDESVTGYVENLIRGKSSPESAIPSIRNVLDKSGIPGVQDSQTNLRRTEVQGNLTYMIGRSAEEYFFQDEKAPPRSFASDAKDQLRGIYFDASGTHQVVYRHFDS